MDFLKAFSMLKDPNQKQQVQSEIGKTLTTFGLTDNESKVFIADFINHTPIEEISKSLSLTPKEIDLIHQNAINKIKAKYKS